VTDSATYLSAVAALVGTFVGGITSIATSWLGQQRQTKELRRAREKAEMQSLYKQFILDASKLYTDALVLRDPTVDRPRIARSVACLQRSMP
jgi:gas vesicle protein